jgi:hypothetical protein
VGKRVFHFFWDEIEQRLRVKLNIESSRESHPEPKLWNR